MPFDTLPAWVNGAIFVAAAAVTYAAGTRLATYADGIAERTHFSRIMLGVVLLGVATSLPEIATTITAASIGNAALVSGNLFGGVSLQVAVLAIVDLVAVRGRCSCRRTPSTVAGHFWRSWIGRQHLPPRPPSWSPESSSSACSKGATGRCCAWT